MGIVAPPFFASLMTATSAVHWIESTSWELPFFGLPQRIPWPADVDPAEANKDPFEMDHLLRAIELLGDEAGEPWTSFRKASPQLEELSEALEDGETVRATELLAEVDQIHPGTAFSLYHKGYVARQQGREEDALNHYREAAEKAPQVGAIWNNLGSIYVFRGQRDEAVAAFRKALELKSNDPVALEGLAQLRVLVRLQAQDPQNPKAVAYVDIPTFHRMAQDQLPQLATSPDQLLGLGEQLLRDGLIPDVGLQALEQAAALRPTHPRTLLALGAAYRVLEQHDKARAAVTRYTEAYPQDANGFFHLAQVCNAAGDHDAERAALERTLELEPNFQQAIGVYFGLGEGEHDPAKEEALAKWSAERKSWMGYVIASTIARQRGDTAAALRHAERAVEIDPESEDVLLHYAAALGESREFAKLASVIKPAVESGRYSRRLDWNYAQVLREAGLTNDAIAVLRKGLNDPNAPEDFKKMSVTVIDAWTGYLAGSGSRLEVHPAGVLPRPVLITLPDGDEGGVVLNPGAPLPLEARFPWRAQGNETVVMLQQGQAVPGSEPHRLGSFRVGGIQPNPSGPTTIDCHVAAQPDGALHFRATQNNRKLPVAWTNYTGPITA